VLAFSRQLSLWGFFEQTELIVAFDDDKISGAVLN
jgi:hypothetical protein